MLLVLIRILFCFATLLSNPYKTKIPQSPPKGIKQFLCQICNYNGVTQSDLNRHCKTRSHVLRSANVCPLCSLGFSTRTLLEDHLVKFHDTSDSTASVLAVPTNNALTVI